VYLLFWELLFGLGYLLIIIRQLPFLTLTGLPVEDVKIITESKKLRFEITDSIFYKELPRGSVAKQNPKPGSKVKK
jgi:hypothetical protein